MHLLRSHNCYVFVLQAGGAVGDDNADTLTHHELLLPGHLLCKFLKEKLEDCLLGLAAQARKDMAKNAAGVDLQARDCHGHLVILHKQTVTNPSTSLAVRMHWLSIRLCRPLHITAVYSVCYSTLYITLCTTLLCMSQKTVGNLYTTLCITQCSVCHSLLCVTVGLDDDRQTFVLPSSAHRACVETTWRPELRDTPLTAFDC